MPSSPKAEIWKINSSGAIGHEQKQDRPALIWKDLDHIGMAIVIPFTSSSDCESMAHTHPVSPSPGNGLEKESIALVFQIKSIDKKRLIKKLGVLEETEFSSIGRVLKDMLRF